MIKAILAGLVGGGTATFEWATIGQTAFTLVELFAVIVAATTFSGTAWFGAKVR